jgi:MFS family permease
LITASGTLLTGAASLLFAVINPAATYWAFGFPSAAISVIGGNFVYAAGTLFVAKFAEPHEQSVGGAVFQTMTQLGTSVGLTVSTIVFHRVQDNQQNELEPYRATFWTLFGFGVLGCLFSIVFLRNVGIVGQRSSFKAQTEKP